MRDRISDLVRTLADVRTHLRTVLVSTCPDEHKVPLRLALAIIEEAIGNPDGWMEQDTYAGICDGHRWVEMIESFEAAAREHRECGPHRKSAAEVADRMAATTHDVMPDLMMAATEFLLAEWDEPREPGKHWEPAESKYIQTFDEMCESFFTSDYNPKDATAFLKDLIARLSGNP